MEKPVHFTCGKDLVFGVLHIPENSAGSPQRAGILFINAGFRYRIGPYRQYVRFARKFCQAGFYVLRFDLPGTGDSEGHFIEAPEVGQFVRGNVDNTVRAIDFFITETGIERLGLFGLCSGAYIALHTGADPRVNLLILLSFPMEQFNEVSEEARLHIHLQRYLKKSLRWRSWLNLILLRSNFRLMLKVLGQLRTYRYRKGRGDRSIWQAFKVHAEHGKRVLFIFGERDEYYRSFVAGFGRRLSDLAQGRRSPSFEVFVVKEADHLFSQLSWQDMVIEKSTGWLKTSLAGNELFQLAGTAQDPP